MRRRETLTARQTYTDIAGFNEQDNPGKAIEYLQAVQEAFWNLPDFVTFRRASPNLPEAVREIPVAGFKGYTLRIVRYTDGVTYLLSAHRPGRLDANKDRTTRRGLGELND